MLLNFKKQFVPFIEEGSKTHTIRAKRVIRPRVGEICHCYTGLRQKGARLLGRFRCVKVQDISIRGNSIFVDDVDILIDGELLSGDERNALAWRDGFRGRGKSDAFAEMMGFWDGRLPFEGDMIHWQYAEDRGRSLFYGAGARRKVKA